MSDEERVKQFLRDGPINNQEILINLAALRGPFYAEIVSELANVRLCMSIAKQHAEHCPVGFSDVIMRAGFSDVIMHVGINLSSALCHMHNWNAEQFLADIDMMFKARTLRK